MWPHSSSGKLPLPAVLAKQSLQPECPRAVQSKRYSGCDAQCEPYSVGWASEVWASSHGTCQFGQLWCRPLWVACQGFRGQQQQDTSCRLFSMLEACLQLTTMVSKLPTVATLHFRISIQEIALERLGKCTSVYSRKHVSCCVPTHPM